MDNNFKTAATSPWQVMDLTLRLMQQSNLSPTDYPKLRGWVINELAHVQLSLHSFPYAPYRPDENHEANTKLLLDYLQNHQSHY